jgi:DNA-binding transcriptional regulator LsrR (DeoR family)
MSIAPERPPQPNPRPEPTGTGPAATVLAATIARRYYFDGRSKSEIASELGLSRFKVARVLDQARESGLVRIELHYEGEIDVDLSVRLASELGVRRCLVIDTPDEDETQLRNALGRVAAGLLAEMATPEDVLGMAWSRTLMAMSSALSGLAPCAVVQLSGALSRPDVDESSIELVRQIAQTAGGAAYCFYAPMIVPEAETARSLRAQPELARAMERFRDLTMAMVSIGAWIPGHSTVADAVSEEEYTIDRDRGARAEVCGVQLDENGVAMHTPLSRRLISIPPEQLRSVPEIIAVAYGAPKAGAVRAAVRGGFVTTLVTHASLAAELLPG